MDIKRLLLLAPLTDEVRRKCLTKVSQYAINYVHTPRIRIISSRLFFPLCEEPHDETSSRYRQSKTCDEWEREKRREKEFVRSENILDVLDWYFIFIKFININWKKIREFFPSLTVMWRMKRNVLCSPQKRGWVCIRGLFLLPSFHCQLPIQSTQRTYFISYPVKVIAINKKVSFR